MARTALFEMKSRVLLEIDPQEILLTGKQPLRVKAKSLVCYWAVKELGMTGTEAGKLLGLTQPAVSKAVQRGEWVMLIKSKAQ